MAIHSPGSRIAPHNSRGQSHLRWPLAAGRTVHATMSGVPGDSASVVIIGAGIVGASVAYHLSARGCRDVIVLEKAAAEATGSTARSAAGVRHQFATEVNIRLSRYSIERLKRFTEEVGGEAGLKQIGYLLLRLGTRPLGAIPAQRGAPELARRAEPRAFARGGARPDALHQP